MESVPLLECTGEGCLRNVFSIGGVAKNESESSRQARIRGDKVAFQVRRQRNDARQIHERLLSLLTTRARLGSLRIQATDC